MLYSGEQILSFKSCLVFYAGDSLTIQSEGEYTYYHLFGIITSKMEILSIEIYEVVHVLPTLISIQ